MIQEKLIKYGAEFLNMTEEEFKKRIENNQERSTKDWNRKKSIKDFYKTTEAYIYGLVGFNDSYRIDNMLHPLLGLKNSTILDYGGGIGIIGMVLATQNTVYYYDLDSKTKEFAKFLNTKLKTKIIFTNDEKEAFSKYVKVIICVDVLEHLETPMKLVKKITKKLSVNGIFLTTGLTFSIGKHTPMHLPDNLKFRKEYNNYMKKYYRLLFYHSTKNESIYLFQKLEK